ncbi:MAG TPA: LysR family transcriptional regulator, partial [Alphaproteobacteria bacterium]|nr:LysR family transcriptional regulator [Alphaproteobacteria bacterium]
MAESGSVQKASERLHLTQSAVSRQIQRLEEALGTILLDRRNKPPTLTPAGLLALERGRQILAAVDDLRIAFAKDGEPEGPLRVGIAHSLSESGIAEPIYRLARSFPRLSLTLVGGWTSTLVAQIGRGEIDAAIVLESADSPAVAPGVTSRTLGHEPFFVMAGEKMLRPSLDEIAARGWVLNPDGCGVRAALRSALEQAGLRFRIAAEVHDFDLKVALIARGLGIGLLPARRLARH